MVMQQCLHCKNTNAQCRQSFVLYYMALKNTTELANDGNRDSKFFKDKSNKREFNFDVYCSKYIDSRD